MSESCKQALLLIAITVCLVLVLNPNALSSVPVFGQRRAELPRRVLSSAEMQQFTTTANTGEIVMVGSNGVLIDQGTQALRVGTADVTILTNNLERLKVMNDGVVKINASNADALYWYDATTNNMIGGLGNSGGTDKGWVGLYDGATQKVALRASGVSTFTGGNVGIGTTNPFFTASIVYQGDNDSSTTSKYNFGLEVSNTNASGPNNRSNLILFTDGNSSQGAIGGYRFSHSGNFTGGLQFLVGSQPTGYKTDRPISTAEASSSLTEAMRIDPYGNVGIGTNNPNWTLTVEKDMPFTSSTANPIQAQVVIKANTQRLALGAYRTGGVGAAASIQSSDFYDSKDNGMNLLLNPLGGNVGIGVTNPWSSSSLEVLRNITFRPETFTVGGNVNTWYKVKVASPTQATARFCITRAVHQDVIGEGSMSLDVEFRGGNCGNGSTHLAWKYNQYSPNGRYFVARVSMDESPDGGCAVSSCYLYLLGARGYSFSGINCAIEHFSADGTSPGTVNTLTTRDQPFASSPWSCSSDWRTGIYSKNGDIGIRIIDPETNLHVNGGNESLLGELNRQFVITYAPDTASRCWFTVGPGGNLFIHPTRVGSWNSSVLPGVDAAINLGASSWRWATIFASNGVIQTSDSNQKDAQALPYGLNEILKIRTIKYKWKSQASLPDNDPKKNFEYYGFCADELAPVFPELVYDEDKNEPIQMNYSELLPVVVNALKEEHAIVERQRQQIQDLNTRLSRLESLLSR